MKQADLDNCLLHDGLYVKVCVQMSSEIWSWKGHCLPREFNCISSHVSAAYTFIHNEEISVQQLFIGIWLLWPFCVFQVLLRRKINAKVHHWQSYLFLIYYMLNDWVGSITIIYWLNTFSFLPGSVSKLILICSYGTFATWGCDGYVDVWDGNNKKRLYQLFVS